MTAPGTAVAPRGRPILFSAPMVRALLSGAKTQTRRLVKHIPALGAPEDWCHRYLSHHLADLMGHCERYCPYGQRGQRLWVRETVAIERWTREYGDEPPLPADRPHRKLTDPEGGEEWFWPHYRATDPAPDLSCESAGCRPCEAGDPSPHWTPSIHMPRWACRIVLEVTDVCVQRLQDISVIDAMAEGVDATSNSMGSAYTAFASLWDSINGAGAWDANPWVWAISFRRVAP